MDKYNYIILGADWDLYLFSYSDLFGKANVKYIADSFPPANSLKGFIYRLHFHPKINSIINLPGKELWNKSYFDVNFETIKPLCFIIFSNWIEKNIDIIGFIRKKHPTAKIVCMMQDLVSTKHLRYSRSEFDGNRLNELCDLVISFDQGDCAKYGYIYHSLVFSSFHGTIEDMPQSDIYMLAKAKNRLKVIYEVYDILHDANLKIDMILTGVPALQQRKNTQIKYSDSGLTYAQNLQHILHTRCILEIMQKGGIGYTQRGCEAVCLDKKLLTNNPRIIEAPFYNPNYISSFDNPKDIDKDFLTSLKVNQTIDYHYKEKMSPIELLNFIEQHL